MIVSSVFSSAKLIGIYDFMFVTLGGSLSIAIEVIVLDIFVSDLHPPLSVATQFSHTLPLLIELVQLTTKYHWLSRLVTLLDAVKSSGHLGSFFVA